MRSDKYSFASDNCAGVHKEIMKALVKVNEGYVHSYGDDVYTKEAEETINRQFDGKASIYFVYNGTGANVTGITQLVNSYHTVFCSRVGHIHVDECGSLEHYAGCKVIALPSSDGKISPEMVAPLLVGVGDEHRSQPGLISITQPTEYGVLYSQTEIRALSDFAHQHHMHLHMDGARISNAAAALQLSLKELTSECGVDLLSLGATKNGLMFGEAVVFLNKALEKHFPYVRKQGMQLHSKMRFIAAQFQEMFGTDLWIKNAAHANKMANRLMLGIQEHPDIILTQPVHSNVIFVRMPERIIPELQSTFHFYVWDESKSEVRLMTSYQTTEQEVDNFIDTIRKMMQCPHNLSIDYPRMV